MRSFLIDTDTASDDAVALDPAVATLSRRLPVVVECQSALCRGQTLVDHLLMTG
jgi:inosine-uridine nucleoside N-ribohydrolase